MNKQITIALPGECRLWPDVKSALVSMGLIASNDINLDMMPLKWSNNVRFLSLRWDEAIRYFLWWKIAGVISGDDALTEKLLANGKRIYRDGDNALGYDTYVADEDNPDYSEECPIKVLDVRQRINRLFSLDALTPSSMWVLTRKDEERELMQISRKGEILTSYPYLVRSLLSQKFRWYNVWSIAYVSWKVEALLAAGFWRSAIDIVDTGSSAKKNWLKVWETLFQSFPIGLFFEKDLQDGSIIKKTSNTLIEANSEAVERKRRSQR